MTLTDIEGRAYCEEFAIRLFGRLDNSEKEGGADMSVPPTAALLVSAIIYSPCDRSSVSSQLHCLLRVHLLTPVPPTGRWPSISLSRRHSLKF